MYKKHRICEICGVRERHCRDKTFFARFPLAENRCRLWVKAAGKEDLVHVPIEKLHDIKYICEKHFKKRDFTKSGTRLKKHAVPKLNLSATPLSDSQLAHFPLHIPKDTNKVSCPVLNHPSQENAQKSTPAYEQGEVSKAAALDHTYAAPAKASGPVQAELEQVPQSMTKSSAISSSVHTEIAQITSSRDQGLIIKRSISTAVPIAISSGSIEMAQITPASGQGHVSNDHTYVASIASSSDHSKIAQSTLTCQQLEQTPVPMTVSTASSSVHTEIVSAKATSTNKQGLISTPVHVANTSSIKEIDMTPRKKKLMALLRKTKCTVSSLKKSAKLIESISSPVLKELVMSAIKNQKRKPQGKRWTTKNKISALAIFKRSPKAYRYLQHIMPLPSTKTLQNILKQIPMEPGINPAVINILKKKASTASDLDKYCVLTYDEMAIKRRVVYNEATDKVEGFVDFGGKHGRTSDLADHCLVFQLQGIRKKFKQPLAFYFTKGTVSSERLAVLIKENIDSVSSTGYRVIGTVCDQGPTNMGALKLLREWHNGGENYFVHNNEKVYNICDVPHLLKSIRNNFMKHGIIRMENKIGKWSHILEVEKQNRNFLYMSKISITHVMPKYRAKMKVKYAAQILSQTVAAVLKLLSKTRENEDISEEMLQTASIVEDFNRLFDFTNGPSNSADVKKYIRENVSSKTAHLSVWTEFRQKLATVTFFNNHGKEAKNVRCIDGYITSLKSFQDLWILLRENGFKYLNLRQLNQDALENLFGLIRQHSPTNRHPTCSSLMAALKTSVISGMTAPHSRGANCEKDYQSLLTDFHELVFPEKQSSEETEEVLPRVEESVEMPTPPSPPTLSFPDDYIEHVEIESDLSDAKEQPLVYVSGYIASVILKKYSSCDSCKKSLSVSEPKDNPIYELIKLKEWWQDKICLTYPSVQLCRTVETAVNFFEKEIIPVFYQENLCQLTVTIFHINCDISWVCTDHSYHLVNHMFTRLALLFIRRQCQKINCDLAVKEEELSDANKKGQQYGVSK